MSDSESPPNENLVKSEGQNEDNSTENIESSNRNILSDNSKADSLENSIKKEEINHTNDVSMEDEEVNNSVDDEEISDEEDSKSKLNSKVITQISTKTLYQEPEFAELCSFFNAFGSAIGLKYSIKQLEELLCTHVNGKADPELIELHLFLMRRVRLNWARADKFDLCLQRYCEICPALDSEILELKRFEYVDLSMNAKLTILKALCESQFDFNYKFKETIFHTFSHSDLRLTPIGFDKNGCAFYYQQDFELALRVYSYELDDQSGASWTLRAKSVKELYKLIQDLKSSDYGSKKDSDNEEEIDEDKIVGGVAKTESKDEEIKDLDDNQELIIEMSDADKEKIQMSTKKYTCWDIFQADDQLNKKQKIKEERRKNRESGKAVVEPSKVNPEEEEEVDDAKSDKSDQKIDEPEEEDLSEFMEDRRILPRRSARSNAINNLKQFTTPSRKKADPKKSDVIEKPVSEVEDSSEEDEFEESDNEDEELGSSDDEFVGPKSKRRGRKKKTDKKQRKLKSTSSIPRKRAPKPVAFDEESSSDEDEEEVKQKERKKANEKSLCMKCKGSKRPDVLLLCDMCDDAWHIFCLRPPLHFVPDGDWFCPNCHHNMLIQKLSFAFIQHQELQKIRDEEERQKAIELERLNRNRRKPNGVDLKNIIPAQNQYDSAEFQSSEEDIDDGQRKSKRRALKKVCKRTYQDQRDLYSGPVLTIAEGRSRRNLNKVDYNFEAYDEQLQEAMHASDSPVAQTAYERPTGLGRGKDMATILEAEERRGSLDDGDEKAVVEKNNDEQANSPSNISENNGEDGEVKTSPKKIERKQGRAPGKKKARRSKKLTDLDLDNATESDTDEYRASEDEKAEEDEISTDEYMPSEEERRQTRGGARYLSRTRSDDEFIDDSDSDFELKKRKGKATDNRKRKSGGKGRGGKKSKRRKNWSESEEETDESEPEYQSESSDDDKPRRNVGKKPTTTSTGRKWEPKVSSSEDEEVEMEEEDSDGSGPTTETGRPLRKAATEMKKKLDELEKQGAEIDLEDEIEETSVPLVVDTSKIIGQPRRRVANKIDSDEEDEFKPDDNESDAAEESVDEEIEEELAKELVEKKQRRKIQAESSDNESSEPKVESNKELTKPTVKVTPQRPTTSRRSPQKANVDNGTSKSSIKRQETQESQRVSTPEDPTPPVSANRRGGRRKSDAPPAPKSPTKRKSRQNAQITPTTSKAVPSNQVSQPQISHQQPLEQLEQMQSIIHHPAGHSLPPNVTYVSPQQTVAYALPPHIRSMSTVHYVQAPPHHVMQPGYEYYGAPPQQYLHGPPTSHHYPPPPAHLIAQQPNTYQVYAMPYSHGDQAQVTQLQTMRPVDPDSLGHALAGAMNPDAL